MHFACCSQLSDIQHAAAAGFHYVELRGKEIEALSEKEFREFLSVFTDVSGLVCGKSCYDVCVKVKNT